VWIDSAGVERSDRRTFFWFSMSFIIARIVASLSSGFTGGGRAERAGVVGSERGAVAGGVWRGSAWTVAIADYKIHSESRVVGDN